MSSNATVLSDGMCVETRSLLHCLDRVLTDHVRSAVRWHQGREPGHGLFMSDSEALDLLGRPLGLPLWCAPADVPAEAFLSQVEISAEPGGAQAEVRWRARPDSDRLRHLCQTFSLSAVDAAILVIALAPEADRAYGRLFAYLQDDMTQSRPSLDLLVKLVCSRHPDAQGTVASRLDSGAPLRRHQLVALTAASGAGSRLERAVWPAPRIAAYLLGSDAMAEELAPVARFHDPRESAPGIAEPDVAAGVANFATSAVAAGAAPLTHLCGPEGTGRQAAAAAACEALGCALLVVDAEALANLPREEQDRTIGQLGLEAALHPAALLFEPIDALLPETQNAVRRQIFTRLRAIPLFFAGQKSWDVAAAAGERQCVVAETRIPGFRERARIWKQQLGEPDLSPELDLDLLAGQFRFAPAQIRRSVRAARAAVAYRAATGRDVRLSMADLTAACRRASSQRLSQLAERVIPRAGWGDLVLPPHQHAALHDIRDAAKLAPVVYGDWGFGEKLALGKGVNVLFSGPPGTGKTLAAEVIAGDLGVDLYKIDLSRVISKYIGETEKNLSAIFEAAQHSNALLFFDEADALFGKRSEVRDSHDRYANIEVGYLLQRIESFDGLVILATNLSKNMDEAFARRMHFSLEFPMPSVADRQRIWERMWPDSTPRAADLDFAELAQRFSLSGGSIKNIALCAAFMGAADGGVVRLSHLLRATQREYQKVGKLMTEWDLPHNGVQGNGLFTE